MYVRMVPIDSGIPERRTDINGHVRMGVFSGIGASLMMLQYYRDLWEKRSHLIAPLTDLIGECGETKTTKKKKTKKKPFYWSEVHNEAYFSKKT